MKKLLLISMMMLATVALMAQEKRFNAYGGYLFDDSFDTYYSSSDYINGKIKGGFQWGGGIEFMVREGYGVELIYYRQDTQVPVNYYNIGAVSRTLDVGINYILLGTNKYLKTGKVEPYGGFVLGAAILSNKNPQPGEETSKTKFAVGLRLGVNIWASDRVALKLQAQLLSAVQGFGGGFYVGTGGAGAGASTYSTITQVGLGGGLSFKIGN